VIVDEDEDDDGSIAESAFMKAFVDTFGKIAPDFIPRLTGATPETVDEIEALSGQPLPAELREYFLTIGGTAPDACESPWPFGRLPLLRQGRSEIEFTAEAVVCQLRRASGSSPHNILSPHYILVGVETNGYDVRIETNKGRIVRFDSSEPVFLDKKMTSPRVWFDGFESMLFSLGVLQLCMQTMPHQAYLGVPATGDLRPSLAALESAASACGLDRVAGTGGWTPCFVSPSAAAILFGPPDLSALHDPAREYADKSVSMSLSASSPARMAALLETFAALGLSHFGDDLLL